MDARGRLDQGRGAAFAALGQLFEACLHYNDVSLIGPFERLIEIGAVQSLECLDGFAVALECNAVLCIQSDLIFAEYSSQATCLQRGDNQAAENVSSRIAIVGTSGPSDMMLCEVEYG
jgi:hypothetical protein